MKESIVSMQNRGIVIFGMSIIGSIATSAGADSDEYKYVSGKCVNDQAIEGLNPKTLGECGDLRGMNFAGRVLKGLNLKGARFDGNNLAGADLSEADLTGAVLDAANLQDALIDHAKLSGASAMETDF